MVIDAKQLVVRELNNEIREALKLRREVKKIDDNIEIPHNLSSQYAEMLKDTESKLQNTQLKEYIDVLKSNDDFVQKRKEDIASELECTICHSVPKPGTDFINYFFGKIFHFLRIS